MNYIILIIIAIVSFTLGRKTVKKTPQDNKTFTPKEPEEMKEIREEAHQALTERTEKRKEKILNLMNTEAVHDEELKVCMDQDPKHSRSVGQDPKPTVGQEGITTENVEKLLDVSGATARKYLNELEDEGKIKQNGKTGKDVYYTLLHQN